jgi:dihydroorotase
MPGRSRVAGARRCSRDGKVYLKPVQTVINGVPFGRPYQSPFAVR